MCESVGYANEAMEQCVILHNYFLQGRLIRFVVHWKPHEISHQEIHCDTTLCWVFTVFPWLSLLRVWLSPPIQNLCISTAHIVCHQFYLRELMLTWPVAGGSLLSSPQKGMSHSISIVQSPVPARHPDNYVTSCSYDQQGMSYTFLTTSFIADYNICTVPIYDGHPIKAVMSLRTPMMTLLAWTIGPCMSTAWKTCCVIPWHLLDICWTHLVVRKDVDPRACWPISILLYLLLFLASEWVVFSLIVMDKMCL